VQDASFARTGSDPSDVDFVFDLRSADGGLASPTIRAALLATRDTIAKLPRALPPINFFMDDATWPCNTTSWCTPQLINAWLAQPSSAPWRSNLVLEGGGGSDAVVQFCRFSAEMAMPIDQEVAFEMLRGARVPSPSNKYRDRLCKNSEMAGFYHTIVRFPEPGLDIYLTE